MLSLATRMWEEIKHDEKDPRTKGKPWGEKSLKDTRTTATQPNTPKDTTRPSSTENKPKEKAENRPWKPRGPKEYASGKNEKGERICYIYGSTGHLANFHKKDDKGDAE